MTAVMTRHLLFSLPSVLMSEIYKYDDTYRIFGTNKFKDDLHNCWLEKQSACTKNKVSGLIRDYIYNFPVCMFKNDYCYIGGPSDQIFKDDTNIKRAHIARCDGFMVYIAPPKHGVLYYKILPKEFINKPQEFFELTITASTPINIAVRKMLPKFYGSVI